jgi:serine/threonine protein kinase
MRRDAETWEQLQALFHLAEQAPEDEREQILTENCADSEVIGRVMAIFRGAHVEVGPGVAQSWTGSVSSSRIGPYTIIRHLGTGGLGSVYLVERIAGGVVQRAALKMLAPHAAGPAFIERFHREQHILASLEHPNITRMLDAGLGNDGQPYLVMEFVNGVHLDVFCDEKMLGIIERLELFLQVCEAVAYAHRNLIVHLDLKPSNILVTPDGIVKLLDFGTSKLINPDSLLTTTVAATPAYASPEQLRNDPVTTSCDVYSLGVVLYELLSGRRPNDKSSVAIMIERAMREQEPESLQHTITESAATNRGLTEGRLRAVLSGDLATIAAKCLRPRPMDRYTSLDALAGDIERYMDGRPVLAQRQTNIYRISKFIRRNRKAVTAFLIMNVIILGSLGYGGWRQQQAIREGQRALRMQTFMYRLFKLANSNYTGKPAATVPEFLQLGVKMLPDYIKNPADLREAQLGLAESMYENGDLDDAQKVFTTTIASAKAAGDMNAEAESEAFSGNIAYLQGQMDLGKDLTSHALELSRRRDITPTVRVWSEIYYAWNREDNGFRDDENVRLLRSAVKEARDRNLSPHETADALYNLGSDLELRGSLDEAEQVFLQASQIYSEDPSALCDQSEVFGDIAYINDMRGNIPASLPLYQRAYDGYKQCSGPESRGALTEQEYLAGALIKLGRSQEALPMMEAAMPIWRKMIGNSPDLAEPLNFLALADVEMGHYAEGEKVAQEMVEVQTGKVEASDRRFGASHMLWARALAGQGRYREALPHAEIADRLLAKGAVSTGGKKAASDAHNELLAIQSKLAAK